MSNAVRLGIYEKALCGVPTWDMFFRQVRTSGFSFMDLSVDETQERMARLDWSIAERSELRKAARSQGIQIGGMCLSCHRKIGPGSADPEVRQEADRIFKKAIDLCYDIGIPLIQVAGYYAYYEKPDSGQRERYVSCLARAAQYASQVGVMLGIKNVDGNDVTSISKGISICDEIGSAWLNMYPDIGNLAEQELDTRKELKIGEGRMLALHVEDVFPGQPRRVPFGSGTADFDAAFKELARQKWSGRMMLEMWNDGSSDSTRTCIETREKLTTLLRKSNISVTE